MIAHMSRFSANRGPIMWTGACVGQEAALGMASLWWCQERKRGRSVVAVLAGVNTPGDDVWSISVLSVGKRVRKGPRLEP